MALAFNAGCLVDYIGNTITFTNGFGWAIGYACATGDAIFSNFHGHNGFSVKEFVTDIKLSYDMKCVN